MMCPEAAAEIIVLSVAQPPEPEDIVEVDAVIDSATQIVQGVKRKGKGKEHRDKDRSCSGTSS